MKLISFRYFINDLKQPELFAEKKSKASFAAEIFERDWSFNNKRSEMAYVFFKREGSFVHARIGRRSKIKKNLPPQKRFKSQTEEHWPECEILIYLDPNPKTGQKILFEFKANSQINPVSALEAFISHVNSTFLMKQGYFINLNVVSEEASFWEIIDKHKGSISEVSFTLAAPNLFNLDNELNADLKAAQLEYNMVKAEIAFKNPNGDLVVPRNELINQSVEYATKGGGEYRIKIGKLTFSSKKGNKHLMLDDVDLSTTDKDIFIQIMERIFL